MSTNETRTFLMTTKITQNVDGSFNNATIKVQKLIGGEEKGNSNEIISFNSTDPLKVFDDFQQGVFNRLTHSFHSIFGIKKASFDVD